MKHILMYITTALFVLTLSGCGAGTPVYNVKNTNALAKDVSLAQVETAIKQGAMRKNWTIKKEKEKLLTATLNIRGKHIAIVSIAYDTNGYSITYKDSHNLSYDPSANTIHKNYNKWIQTLEKNINYQLATIGVQPTRSSIAASNPKPVATVTTHTSNLKKSGNIDISGKTVYIKSVVPYARSSRVADNIKTECTIDQQLSEFIVSAAQAHGLNVVVKNNISKNDIELKVEILDAVSQGGAMRGHNKFVSISGSLVKGDKVYQSFRAARVSGGGFFGAYKSSCSVLGRTVKALGNDTATWLSSPADGIILGDAYLIR